jgi:hypothetical protein
LNCSLIDVPQDAWIGGTLSAALHHRGRMHPRLEGADQDVVRYADNLWETRWHDGNKLSLADLCLLSSGFDRASPKAHFRRGRGAGLKTF